MEPEGSSVLLVGHLFVLEEFGKVYLRIFIHHESDDGSRQNS
jgi:hypothetical protein